MFYSSRQVIPVLAMALIKHCIRVISWNNRILKSLAAFERTVIKVLAVFLQLLMSAEGCVPLPFIGARVLLQARVVWCQYQGQSPGGNSFALECKK